MISIAIYTGCQLMINTQLIKSWVAALRSDKYKQTTGQLRREDNRFCCLGVACDVIDPTGWGTRVDATASYMPYNIYTKLGFGYHDQVFLSQINDLTIFSFKDIADIIEHKYILGHSFKQMSRMLFNSISRHVPENWFPNIEIPESNTDFINFSIIVCSCDQEWREQKK